MAVKERERKRCKQIKQQFLLRKLLVHINCHKNFIHFHYDPIMLYKCMQLFIGTIFRIKNSYDIRCLELQFAVIRRYKNIRF